MYWFQRSCLLWAVIGLLLGVDYYLWDTGFYGLMDLRS